MTEDEFNRMIAICENAYHRAKSEFELPNVDTTYSHIAKDGLVWSCPYRPVEIADLLYCEFYDTVIYPD